MSALEKYSVGIIFSIFILIFVLFNPRFLSLQNITNILIQMVPIAIVSLGLMFVVGGGELLNYRRWNKSCSSYNGLPTMSE